MAASSPAGREAVLGVRPALLNSTWDVLVVASEAAAAGGSVDSSCGSTAAVAAAASKPQIRAGWQGGRGRVGKAADTGFCGQGHM